MRHGMKTAVDDDVWKGCELSFPIIAQIRKEYRGTVIDMGHMAVFALNTGSSPGFVELRQRLGIIIYPDAYTSNAACRVLQSHRSHFIVMILWIIRASDSCSTFGCHCVIVPSLWIGNHCFPVSCFFPGSLHPLLTSFGVHNRATLYLLFQEGKYAASYNQWWHQEGVNFSTGLIP